MSLLAAKVLIVGVPLVISLAWFLFWVLRLTRAGRKIRSASGSAPGNSVKGPRDKPAV